MRWWSNGVIFGISVVREIGDCTVNGTNRNREIREKDPSPTGTIGGH